jgi:hypothetical protein
MRSASQQRRAGNTRHLVYSVFCPVTVAVVVVGGGGDGDDGDDSDHFNSSQKSLDIILAFTLGLGHPAWERAATA